MNKRKLIKKECLNREDIISRKKSRLEKISRKISPITAHKDENNKIYIHYCSFHEHRGNIGNKKYEEKQCSQCYYYKKLTEK